MRKTVNLQDFIEAFRQDEGYADGFSETGLKKLFAYLQNKEEEIGEEFELDVIDLGQDYFEDTPKKIVKDFFLFPRLNTPAGYREEARRFLVSKDLSLLEETPRGFLYSIFNKEKT